jgi:glycerate-2-kinase
VRSRSYYQARQQGTTVYRSLLDLSSPAAVAMKLPVLAAQLYNFGTTEAREVGTNTVEVVRRGLPVRLMAWYAPGTEAYVTAALSMRGGKNVRAQSSALRVEGRQYGLTVGTLSHTFAWE